MVADAAYHGNRLRDLPAQVTWTTRPPRNAVLYHRAPPATGKRGRPRLKGDRIGIPLQAAADAVWQVVTVTRYGRWNPCGSLCSTACGTGCSDPNRCGWS